MAQSFSVISSASSMCCAWLAPSVTGPVDREHEVRITDWLDEITANCPKKSAHNWNDQCAAGTINVLRGGQVKAYNQRQTTINTITILYFSVN
jgi:hypothetical protein